MERYGIDNKWLTHITLSYRAVDRHMYLIKEALATILTHSLKCQCTEKKKKIEIKSAQNNSSGKINVGIKRYTVMSHKSPTRHTCTCKVLNI